MVLISIIMAAMAIPLVQNVMGSYRLRGAVSSVTGVIQATRYQAIFNGYPFRVDFDSAALTYQVKSDPARAGVFANFCVPAAASCPIPLAGSSAAVAINQNTTFVFSPGGSVQSPQAVGGVTVLNVTLNGKTESITVSSYGNIKVTP